MAIEHVEIIGIREAHNTVGDITYNSTNYSLLIFYDDRSPSLLEGDADLVNKYIRYIKPWDDNESIKTMLASHEAALRAMIQEEVKSVFETLRPLPEIVGMAEDQAIQQLRDAGFTVELLNTYPEGTPLGVVYAVTRKNGAYLTAELDIRHDLPDVVGMPRDQALSVLNGKGFDVEVVETYSSDAPENLVMHCDREGATSMKVKLIISMTIPDVAGMPLEKAREVLERTGAKIVIKNRPHESVLEGHIISWHSDKSSTVELIVSNGKTVFKSQQITVHAGNIEDCRESNFWGSAILNRESRTLDLELHYIMDMNHKHEWLETSYADFVNSKQAVRCRIVQLPKFESGQKQEVLLQLSSDAFNQYNEPIKSIKITLNSQFGTLRKTQAAIPLTIDFSWQ